MIPVGTMVVVNGSRNPHSDHLQTHHGRLGVVTLKKKDTYPGEDDPEFYSEVTFSDHLGGQKHFWDRHLTVVEENLAPTPISQQAIDEYNQLASIGASE
jgi:hypothetical protein